MRARLALCAGWIVARSLLAADCNGNGVDESLDVAPSVPRLEEVSSFVGPVGGKTSTLPVGQSLIVASDFDGPDPTPDALSCASFAASDKGQ